MGDKITTGLLGVYVILALVYGFEGNLGKTLYWLGASLITTGVLVMR